MWYASSLRTRADSIAVRATPWQASIASTDGATAFVTVFRRITDDASIGECRSRHVGGRRVAAIRLAAPMIRLLEHETSHPIGRNPARTVTGKI